MAMQEAEDRLLNPNGAEKSPTSRRSWAWCSIVASTNSNFNRCGFNSPQLTAIEKKFVLNNQLLVNVFIAVQRRKCSP
jgi:hypothetical protein